MTQVIEEVQNQEVVILSKFDVTRNELQELIANYQNLVVTSETYDESKKALAAIREKRYQIQRQQKANDDMRIAWNKKQANDNKSNADELIGILLPTEEIIEKGIKEIEAIKEQEKQAKAKAEQLKVEARTKQITDTGAIVKGDGYSLDDQWIGSEEIICMNDKMFNSVVLNFQYKQKELKEIAEKEAQRIADNEAREKALVLRTEGRRKALFAMGLTHNGKEFVSQLITFGDRMTDEFISTVSDEDFFNITNEYNVLYEKAVKKMDEAKAESDRIAKENEAREKENARKEAELKAESDRINNEKMELYNQKIKLRKTALFALGMAISSEGFSFSYIVINTKVITDCEDEKWALLLEDVTEKIADEKKKIIEEENLKAEREALQKKRVEALLPYMKNAQMYHDLWSLSDHAFEKQLTDAKTGHEEMVKSNEAKKRALIPDKEKLVTFIEELKMITGPELKTDEARGILEHVLTSIHDATKFITISLESL